MSCATRKLIANDFDFFFKKMTRNNCKNVKFHLPLKVVESPRSWTVLELNGGQWVGTCNQLTEIDREAFKLVSSDRVYF